MRDYSPAAPSKPLRCLSFIAFFMTHALSLRSNSLPCSLLRYSYMIASVTRIRPCHDHRYQHVINITLQQSQGPKAQTPLSLQCIRGMQQRQICMEICLVCLVIYRKGRICLTNRVIARQLQSAHAAQNWDVPALGDKPKPATPSADPKALRKRADLRIVAVSEGDS